MPDHPLKAAQAVSRANEDLIRVSRVSDDHRRDPVERMAVIVRIAAGYELAMSGLPRFEHARDALEFPR